MSHGKVTLVGAGPGAPDLITVRAVEALKQADVLLYDRLINPEIMHHASPKAKRVYVGKRKGQDHGARQQRIHALMVGHAQEGKKVVRLKGGDPFVFGRGGEEIIHLRRAGIDVEVVPGISSCISAPAKASIPVTYRGLASSFGVFAGRAGKGLSEPDWWAASRVDTAVFLMGVDRLPQIVARLTDLGRAPDTPVAIIQKAFHEDERTLTGTLADIVAKARGVKPPATIVVGKVVSIRQILSTDQLASEGIREYA